MTQVLLIVFKILIFQLENWFKHQRLLFKKQKVKTDITIH